MRTFGLCVCFLLITTAAAPAQNSDRNIGLPELHTIKTVSLGPSYSCRSAVDFQEGYANTALFLSAYAKKRNSPDLLFNGACKADDEFQPGDYFSLIADLGSDVTLEEVSALRAFNLKRVHLYSEYSKFVSTSKVIANHTYAVLINTGEKRGLFIFTVVDYVPNKKVVLRYAVKSYELRTDGLIQAAGFEWERTNK